MNRKRIKPIETLSPAERAVFERLAKYGCDNDEIAARLRSTKRAVKFHVSNLLKKFGVRSREQLIVLHWSQLYAELKKSLGTTAKRNEPARTRR